MRRSARGGTLEIYAKREGVGAAEVLGKGGVGVVKTNGAVPNAQPCRESPAFRPDLIPRPRRENPGNDKFTAQEQIGPLFREDVEHVCRNCGVECASIHAEPIRRADPEEGGERGGLVAQRAHPPQIGQH